MHLFQLSRSKGTEVLKLQRLVHAPPSSNKSKKKSSKKQRVLRCDRCLWLIYRGNHHRCSKRAKLQNLRAVMSENEKDIITNENLKSKLLGRRCHAMSAGPVHSHTRSGKTKMSYSFVNSKNTSRMRRVRSYCREVCVDSDQKGPRRQLY